MPELTTSELLTTTRAVRRRLDFEREVPRHLVEEAIEIAVQAPNGGNTQSWHWIVIGAPETKQQIARHYRDFFDVYKRTAPMTSVQAEIAEQFTNNLHRAPWLVVVCFKGLLGRMDTGSGAFAQAMSWGSIYPAVWSFMLALRERGLGSVITTNHLAAEREVADLLGIPFERVNQAALLPVAWTLGNGFRPAKRLPMDEVIHWERW